MAPNGAARATQGAALAIPTDLEYIEGCGGMLIMYSKEFEVCPVEGWETVTRGDRTVD